MKDQLWEIPEPSTAGVSGFVLVTSNGRSLELQFDYDRDGQAFTTGIQFLGVRAHRHRAELYLSPWHIEGVYDTLSEVKPSEWVEDLLRAAPTDARDTWIMRHFMISFDSAGCYEVVAEEWERLPEVPGSLAALLGRRT